MATERNTLRRNAVLASILALAAAAALAKYDVGQRHPIAPNGTEKPSGVLPSKNVPACRAYQMVWSLLPPKKSPTGYFQTYVLQNDSSTVCSLDGTPSAYEADLAGHQSLSYISSPNLPRRVTLRPSARASFSIEFLQCKASGPGSATGPLTLTLSIPDLLT